jgi:hypothetical protein
LKKIIGIYFILLVVVIIYGLNIEIKQCQEYKVRAFKLNVREKPTTKSAIKTQFDKNHVVCIYDKNNSWGSTKEGYWLHLDYMEPGSIIHKNKVEEIANVILGFTVIYFLAAMFFQRISQGPYIVRDFKRAFHITIINAILIAFNPLFLILAILAFFTNNKPLVVYDEYITVPAKNNLRSFYELITLNWILGYYYRRKYYFDEILDVRNQYTKGGKVWEAVVSGITRRGNSFSQIVRFSDKQTRDEFRAVMKEVLKNKKGRIGSDFAI